jgi:hypothetical protein
MSKAEERALERYSIIRGDDTQETSGIDLQRLSDFIDGYHQAEEDLKLTWKDMKCIIKHYQDIMAEKSRVFVRVEDYQELLKRFYGESQKEKHQ